MKKLTSYFDICGKHVLVITLSPEGIHKIACVKVKAVVQPDII